MKKAKEPSQVVQLLDIVWRNANDATRGSWERLNHAMRSALQLAIGGGFKFELGDFKHVFENYNSGYWIGESSEGYYSQAIAENNLSAATSYEEAKSREPFIADDVGMGRHSSFAHMVGDRQKERLHVGTSFKWRGQKVEVTSFADDGSHVVACSYEKVDEYRRKVKKRFKITREDIIADRAERKQRAAIIVELVKLIADGVVTNKEILDKIGVKDREGFDAAPIKKVEAALAWAKAESAQPKERSVPA